MSHGSEPSARGHSIVKIPEHRTASVATAQALAFVDKVWHMRFGGFALGALPMGVVLYETRAPAMAWIALVATGFGWAHLARWISRRSPDPRAAEFRSMGMDSALGGAWIALAQFNLVPSAILLTMLSIDKVGIAGWRFLVPTTAILAASALVTSALLGYRVQLESSMAAILASLPLLFAFPVAISASLHRLARTVVRQNRQLELMNRSDMLTGLPNRRHWQEVLVNELARHHRTGRPAVVMLIDVDNFKEVNDRHGHGVGDDVLRSIATVLRGSIREIDTTARYGGDEFAVLVTETDAGKASEIAERIRSTFLLTRGREAARERCTLSIGLAEVDATVADGAAWMDRADAAMYAAKSGGRNRVEVHGSREARSA